MYALRSYEQTAVYDPTNPDQRIREGYASDPGRWTSYYWNPVDTGAQLRGSGLGISWSSLGSTAQIGVIAVVGALAGYFTWKQWGDKLRPTMKKIPIIGSQFAGYKRRGRR
jgi:hypothetical protein